MIPTVKNMNARKIQRSFLLQVMCTDFDLLDILPAGSLRQNVCKGEEFMNRLDKLITGLKVKFQ